MSQDINVLALVKGTERYVFLYDDASRAETLRTLGRFASNPGTELHLVRRRRAEPEDSPGQPQVRVRVAFRGAPAERLGWMSIARRGIRD